jgi:YD repeat-containing protein
MALGTGIVGNAFDVLGRKAATKVVAAGADPLTAAPKRVTSYAYDALGRLQTVTEDRDPASSADPLLATKYWYDLAGSIDRTDLSNGVITDYLYDALGRLDKQTDYSPDGGPLPDLDLSNNPKLAEYNYTVRADGKRTRVVETAWLDADSNSSTPATPHVSQVDCTYDAVGRLTDEAFNHFDNALDRLAEELPR